MYRLEGALKGLIAVAFAVASLGGSTARAADIALDASTGTGGNGWLAVAAPGAVPNNCYPCYAPIDNAHAGEVAGDLPDNGLVPPAFPGIATFEAANPGWNSDPNYDTTGWAAYGGTVQNPQSWIDDNGTNPFFARDVVNIAGTPTAASFSIEVDDDYEFWINGVVVSLDDNLNNGPGFSGDITSYLHSGNNVFAFLADNAHGGGFSATAYGSITYTPGDVSTAPEPRGFVLAGAGILAFLMAARRRARMA